MKSSLQILAATLLLIFALPAPARSGEAPCLADGTLQETDEVAVGAARQSLRRNCSCADFDATGPGRKRGDYRKCIAQTLREFADGGTLRKACTKSLKKEFMNSRCGRPTDRNFAPCLRRVARTNDLRCSIRPVERCTANRRYSESNACAAVDACVEAGDTNEDGLLGPTDTGACAARPRWVRDDQGRALILHGINVSNDAKREPNRVGWTTEADIQRLSKDWGMNAVRLLIFWDAIEPEKGVFDEAYLDRVAERIGWAANAGLWVILDMHQDIYSTVFYGNGAPAWAVRDDGLPFTLQSPWWLNYAQPAVGRAFANFWDHEGPHADLQEHYTMAWLRIVERFKDHPAVLGYDLMNEPFPDISKILTFEVDELMPFYERMLKAIRAVDSENWIFLEPSAVQTNLGLASELPTVFDARLGAAKLAYAPHLYIPSIHEGGPYTDPAQLAPWLNYRLVEMERNPGPALIGEFGVSSEVSGHVDFLHEIFAIADEHLSGWLYWSYDRGSFGPIDSNGDEQEKIEALVRTYAQRIAGDPVLHRFDPATREFELQFTNRNGTTGPTEIYIPAQRFYPGGWVVESSDPPGSFTTAWDADREVLSVTSDPNQANHVIRILPAD